MASIPSPIRKWIRRYITGEGSNEIANQSPVQSVNSQTGDVTISTGGGSIPPSQTVTSYSDLPTTDLSEAEIWLVAGEEDVVVSTQLSPVVWRSVSDFTKVASQIPDNVVYQYPFDTFGTSTWEDAVSTADMTINGLSSSTFADGSNAVAGDGSDFGTANGPQSIVELETWGIALTTQISNISDNDHHFGCRDGNANIRLYHSDFFSPLGQPVVQLRDDSDARLTVSSDTAINDGTKKTIVINKTSNDASDINIYIDDMSSAVSKTVNEKEAYDNTNVTLNEDMGFFAFNNNGSMVLRSQSKSSIFEFNTKPYGESERVVFADRV